MFKVVVLQTLYTLSDDQTEYQLRDRLSFMRFVGLALHDPMRDAKTIWLFPRAPDPGGRGRAQAPVEAIPGCRFLPGRGGRKRARRGGDRLGAAQPCEKARPLAPGVRHGVGDCQGGADLRGDLGVPRNASTLP
jgi:IS5 family transposase